MTVTTGLTIDTAEELREVMRADFTFSDQQFAAITAPLEPAVIIAGAGSGKTTVMAARVVWLVATGQVRPGEVLGLTFTTKAARELGQRIREALVAAGMLDPVSRGPVRPDRSGGVDDDADPTDEEPAVGTYHAYAAGLLTEHGLRIGHEPDTRVITDASRYQLAARAIARYAAPVEQLTDHPETAIRNLLALDAAMSEHLVAPEDVRAHDARHRPLFVEAQAAEGRKTYRAQMDKAISAIDRRGELLGLVEAYRRLKRDLGLMDFADQIELAARLTTEHAEVGAAERAKYRVVLLDEYQDTSVAQALMLSRLFSGTDGAGGEVEAGRGHPVTAVGDPNQAIYGWRGASVSNILHFPDTFPARSGRAVTYPLTVNRRSDARILDTANHLAAELYAGPGDVRPLEAKPEAAPGSVRLAVHETYHDELGWLAERVRAGHQEMEAPSWKEIGVLTRDNAHAADVFDALSEAEIPVEIVGLKGLLRLPEVAEVVATLRLLQDLTANAALLTLLTGPRWAIGPRDLALLGQRAHALVGTTGPSGRDTDRTVEEELAAAVEGADPTEVASLSDALDDPGQGPYSAEALERFVLLAAELRSLRQAVGEPLLDLVRRIIDTTGIDVELASSVNPAAAARRDNLDLFVRAVAEFQAVDGAVTLPALLAWLEAEDEFGEGLDVATPTEADSVKLLTTHRAKGLEWDLVFLVGVCDGKFPAGRGRTQWTTSPAVLPTDLRGDRHDLPSLTGHDAAALTRLSADVKEHEATEERRLGYVAFTRARHELVVSSYCWSPTRKTPLGPSSYQSTAAEALASWQGRPDRWQDKPGKDEPNPYADLDEDLPWPIRFHTEEVVRRHEAAALVREVAASEAGPQGPDEGLDIPEAVRVEQWDLEAERLLAEAARDRSDVIEVPRPSSLSATAVARLREDPERFAVDLARPMPRRPSPAARFGTRFHAWVEAHFGEQELLDPDELPGRADTEIDDEDDLRELIALFEAGPFADRHPTAVEPPFALVLAGQVVRGRIDAVYAEGDGYLVVDWKTNRQQNADPLQLALYRVAWAELRGVPVESVRAAFYYVRTGDLVEHTDLVDRETLERLVSG